MHVADQTSFERVDRVVVQNAVMALMAGGQNLLGLLRDAGHVLALVDAVGHQLLGQHVLAGLHGLDRHDVVQVQRQRDDHALDVLVVEQFVIVLLIDRDVLAGLIFAAPAVFLDQSAANGQRVGAGMIAMEVR